MHFLFFLREDRNLRQDGWVLPEEILPQNGIRNWNRTSGPDCWELRRQYKISDRRAKSTKLLRAGDLIKVCRKGSKLLEDFA